MTREFEVGFEGLLRASPEEVWHAITVESGGWSWPIEYEPRLGGKESGLTFHGGTVTAWEPGRHFATRCEAPGWFNNLDYTLQERTGGTFLRFVHNGIFQEDWDNNYNACRQHTALYYHSLGEYLQHFPGRKAAYVALDAPENTRFAGLKRALGVPESVRQGDKVRLAQDITGRVDYLTASFLGVRTEDALYRFFGRDSFGWSVGMACHLFAEDADPAAMEKSWREWLADTPGSVTAQEK
jgi:uncharacterized protein YndB with AHSA1/START domain